MVFVAVKASSTILLHPNNGMERTRQAGAFASVSRNAVPLIPAPLSSNRDRIILFGLKP